MPDVQELSDNDMSVAQRMATLPDSVLFGEETEDPKLGQPRDDDVQAPDEIRDGPQEADPEQQAAEQEEDEQQAAATEPGDHEFEIPNPDGGEAQRVKASELIEAYQEFTAFKGERTAILSRVQDDAIEAARGYVGQVKERADGVSQHVEALLAHIQPPVQPDPQAMLNPNSPQYDPDGYHLAFANWQRAMGNYNFVKQQAEALKTKAEELKSEKENQELIKLRVFWPEFVDPKSATETQRTFAAALNKHYGFEGEELDAALQSHRYVLAARDAIKWKEHEAEQAKAKATIKEKVVAKTPAKTAQTNAQTRTLTTEQSEFMNARKAMKANGKDMSATAKAFMKFV